MSAFTKKIESIINDKEHGSTKVLQDICQLFLYQRYDLDELRWAFIKLRKINPSMVVIHHFLNELQTKLDLNFKNHVIQYIDKWQYCEERIASYIFKLLPQTPLTILTHSYSGVVIKVLVLLKSKGVCFNVLQTESTPGGEGKLQAEALVRLKLKIDLIADKKIAHKFPGIDVCLLGVDQYNHRGFVNKIGSQAIVDLTKEYTTPLYTIGDSRKQVTHIQPESIKGLFEYVSYNQQIKLINENGTYS